MAEPKIKPEKRVAGKSKFRLPERSPRVVEENPMREILQEAKAQEEAEALAAQPPPQARPTPAKRVTGVGHALISTLPQTQSPITPAKTNAGVSILPELGHVPAQISPYSFSDFSKRWVPILRSGQMSVCRTLFEMTYAIGETECFTSMPKLAAAAGLKERQCYNVVGQLEQLGFIERPDIFNTPTQKGTIFRLYLEPRSPSIRSERRYHIGSQEQE